MFVRDSLFIRKCIRSIVIVKAYLGWVVIGTEIGAEKCNITKQFQNTV